MSITMQKMKIIIEIGPIEQIKSIDEHRSTIARIDHVDYVKPMHHSSRLNWPYHHSR